MVGTAPPARRWLLIELDGGWLPQAFDSIGMGRDARSSIAGAAARANARVMVIRRVGRRSASGPHRAWCVVDDPRSALGPIVTWGQWSVGEDIVDAADLLDRQVRAESDSGATESVSPAAESASATAGGSRHTPSRSAAQGAEPAKEPAPEPELLLACTHGRHDVCCALRGRPVAAALADRWPEATWECSHTGGDRFAANVIALPDGACYGGLDPENAVPVLERHFSGGPDPAHLRGRTGCPPAVQAALVAAHAARPHQRWGTITALGVSSDGDERLVILRTQDGDLAVPVTEEVRPAHQLTCAATTLNRATVPVAGAVRTIG